MRLLNWRTGTKKICTGLLPWFPVHFLGLLGTVWGVMDAFGTMDSGGATIEHLAPGVSGALLTTVTALLVAIPIVFIYNGLSGFTRAEMTKLENFASNLADRIELETE